MKLLRFEAVGKPEKQAFKSNLSWGIKTSLKILGKKAYG